MTFKSHIIFFNLVKFRFSATFSMNIYGLGLLHLLVVFTQVHNLMLPPLHVKMFNASLSHRPTLITILISVLGDLKYKNKKCYKSETRTHNLETIDLLIANHLLEVGGTNQNWVGLNLMQLNYWPCVIVTQTKYLQLATRLWVQVQQQPNFFSLFQCLILE